MSAYKSEFLDVLASRGFIQQLSDAAGLDARCRTCEITAYVGFDATAPSLHIGNLLSIMMLRWLQKTGHRPIVLMGGGTSKIGDPSGKDTTRTLLTDEQIDANIAKIRTVFARFLDFDAGTITANNADWLDQLRLHSVPARGRASFHGQPDADLRLGQAAAGARAAADVPRIQLHDPAGLRFRGAVQASRLHPADGRLGSVGQYRQRHRARTPSARSRAVRADHAAPDHLVRGEDGQDRKRRGLAQCRDDAALRLLAVLAQQRGRRRRAPPEAVHRVAARGDRPAGRAQGSRAQRSQEGAGDRGDRALARPRRRRRGRRDRAADVRGRRSVGIAADHRDRAGRARERARRAGGLRAAGLVASNGEARRQIKGGGLKLNDAAVTDEKMVLTGRDCTPEGVIKLSLGRKRHVLLRPV